MLRPQDLATYTDEPDEVARLPQGTSITAQAKINWEAKHKSLCIDVLKTKHRKGPETSLSTVCLYDLIRSL